MTKFCHWSNVPLDYIIPGKLYTNIEPFGILYRSSIFTNDRLPSGNRIPRHTLGVFDSWEGAEQKETILALSTVKEHYCDSLAVYYLLFEALLNETIVFVSVDFLSLAKGVFVTRLNPIVPMEDSNGE